MEMAGIEPASERLDPRKSTSVAGGGSSPQVIPPAILTCSQPLGPEGPLSRSERHLARHSAFLTPSPITGRSTGQVDAVSLGDRPFTLYCLRSEGHGGVGSAVGT